MVQWNTNSSGNGIWACLNLGNGKDAMLSVYRCIVTNNYIQMVWIDGSDSRYSKSEHACCISAMVHAEAAASNLLDEIAAKSAVWQEV